MSPNAGDARPARPGGVTAAGVLLLVLGSLTLLVNGIVFAIGISEDDVLGLESGPLLLGLTGFGIFLGLGAIASGIGVLQRKPAWRVVGIVAAAIGALSSLINLVGGTGAGIAVIVLIAWVWTIVQLARTGEAFRPAGAPVAPGAEPTMAGGIPFEGRAAASPLGAILALMGAGLVLVAWFVPVVASIPLLALEAPFEFWFWAFLQPLGVVVAAALIAILALSSRADRLKAGILVGVGAVGFLFFARYLWIIVSGAPLGVGTALGLVGTGLIAGGGVAMASRSWEPAGRGRPLGPVLALVGTGMVLLAWVVPLIGGLGFRSSGILIGGSYFPETLEVMGVILAGGAAAAVALAGRGRRVTAGISVGVGTSGALYFLGVAGFQLGAGIVSAVPFLGLVGAALLIAGGAMAAAGLSTASPVALPGQVPGPSAPPPAPPPAAPYPPPAPPTRPPPATPPPA